MVPYDTTMIPMYTGQIRQQNEQCTVNEISSLKIYDFLLVAVFFGAPGSNLELFQMKTTNIEKQLSC